MKRALFIVWTLACTYCANGHAQMANGPDQASFKDKWLIEAKTQWQSYLQEISHYEVRIELKKQWNRSILDYEPVGYDSHVVADYPRSLYYAFQPGSDRIKEVQGVNPEYQFRLTPAQNVPEQWIAVSVQRILSPTSVCQFSTARVDEADAPCDAIVSQTLAMGLALQTTPLPSLLQLDGFTVASVKESTRDGQRIASITYVYEPKSPLRRVQIRSGTAHLLVDHYWLVDSADFFVGETAGSPHRWPFSVKNSYDFTDLSVPVLTSSEWKCFNNTPDRTWRYSMTHNFRFQKTEDRSPERFTLSAFGLPEPDFGSEPRRYRLWSVIVTAIVIGIVLCMILSKRRGMTSRS